MIPLTECSHSHLSWEMFGSALFFYDFPVAVKSKLRQFGVDSKFIFFFLSDILLRMDSWSKRIINSVLISKNTRQSWLVTVLLVFGTENKSITSSLLFSQLMHKWCNFKVKMKNSRVPPSPRATIAQFHSRTDWGNEAIENRRRYWANQYPSQMMTLLCTVAVLKYFCMLLQISHGDAQSRSPRNLLLKTGT